MFIYCLINYLSVGCSLLLRRFDRLKVYFFVFRLLISTVWFKIDLNIIVTGLTRSTSLRKIYNEIGWLSLENRRLYQKLIIAYKVKHGLTPEFLNNIFPDTVGIITPYNLRNNNNYSVMNARTQLFRNSFISSCISSWNNIPEHIRDSDNNILYNNIDS